MRSDRCCRTNGAGFIIATAIAFAVVSCASVPEPMRYEPKTVAKKLGFPDCKVSIPLNPAEVVEMGRDLRIYPNPAEDPEWSKLMAIRQPDDQIRRVSCTTNIFSYVLIRNDKVVFKFDVGSFD